MVYVIRDSKHTKRKKTYTLTVSDAIVLLYNLNAQHFKISRWILFDADSQDEMISVLKYFNSDYFTKIEYIGFDVFSVNPEIKKSERTERGARVSAIDNFKRKITERFTDFKVYIVYEQERFNIHLKKDKAHIKLICNYDMVITHFFGLDADGNFMDMIDYDYIYKEINRMFKNQRYYYRKKEK